MYSCLGLSMAWECLVSEPQTKVYKKGFWFSDSDRLTAYNNRGKIVYLDLDWITYIQILQFTIRFLYQKQPEKKMLFYSFFKSLVGKDVVVELKNDLSICGTLHSVDQYLNIKLSDISVIDPEKYPHMLSVKNCFIRGSVVRYVQLPADEVDTQLLQDAARKEATVSTR